VHGKSSGTTNVCVGTSAECGGVVQNPGTAAGPGGAKRCVVPKLAGKSLTRARKLLTTHGCALGKVKRPRKPRHRKLRPLIVGAQSPKAGRSLPRGTKVALRLKETPVRHRARG
jgi:hypothetical protein